MGRKHSYIDSEFGGGDYDPDDQGEYSAGLICISMPFKGERWDEIYRVIKKECQRLKLRPERVDEYIRSGVVLRDIAKLIEDAEFLIFDLSRERQNVYYELGYAHGVGNEASEILLIAEEGTKLHYDIAGLRVHFYKSLDNLRSLMEKALPEMIRLYRK